MGQEHYPEKSAADLWFAVITVILGVVLGLKYHVDLWTFDANGLSIVSKRLAYWDFSNLWSGSRMVLDGHVTFLFDVDAYRAALRAMFFPTLPDQEWSYPPNILLIGTPLALLPIHLAYAVWTGGTIACLALAVRGLRLPMPVAAAVVIGPAVLMNALFGQNGSLTAALLLGGLLAAPTRPILAGVLFGLLTIKPHLGILVPFCLLASGNWRAIVAASLTAVGLAVLTGLLWGFSVWPQFFTETGALMRGIMEAPYPQHYHSNALTIFSMARGLGAVVGSAYLAQAIGTLIMIGVAMWLWLPSTRISAPLRAATTATMALIATPYGYTYDSIPMGALVAVLFVSRHHPPVMLLAVAWLFPLVAHLLNMSAAGATVLVPLALVAWVIVQTIRDKAAFTHAKPSLRAS